MTEPVIEPVIEPVMTPVAGGLSIRAIVERGEFCLDVEFTAAPGEVVAVLGPNGAGKTTLLRTIAGLTALTSGRIGLDGDVFDDVEAGTFRSADRRPIGLVFQNYRLFPHLSVRENVAFGPRSQHVDRREARRLADRWLDRFGLADFAARKPGALSGGQAQRVALARALAGEPGLLLLDEPLAALDAQTRLEVRAELRRHLADFAGPTLLITHDPLDAMVLADRLLVIEDGRVVQQGTPAEVARRPYTKYVAQLVGLNLYRGRQAGAQIQLEDGGLLHAAFTPPAAPPIAQPKSRSASSPEQTEDEPTSVPVLVAIRPSAIALHTARPEHGSPRNVWAGHVVGLESLTDRIRVQVAASPAALVDVTTDAVAELKLMYGTEVWLSAKATDIDIYPDPTTPDPAVPDAATSDAATSA
jgi:molybdate transport system ATP-binding protein